MYKQMSPHTLRGIYSSMSSSESSDKAFQSSARFEEVTIKSTGR